VVYAERLDLRIGLSFTEAWEIVLRRRFDLLVQRLVIIEGRRARTRKRDRKNDFRQRVGQGGGGGWRGQFSNQPRCPSGQ
jgi:hypothetical protein